MYNKLLWTVVFICSLIMSQSMHASSIRCGVGIKKMVDSLKLDETQKAKIDPILEKLQANMQNIGEEMNQVDTDLQQAIDSDTMDPDKVNGLVDKKSKLIGEMIKAKIMVQSQIVYILNPQQKKELQAMMKKMKDKIAAEFKSCPDQD